VASEAAEGHDRAVAGARRCGERWPLTNILKLLAWAVLLAVCVASPLRAAVIVSSKLSSESAMLGYMIQLLLNADGIATVDRMTLGGTPVVRKAIMSGEIDLYVDYTGNAGFFFNRPSDPVWKDFRKGFELGARLDLEANRIVWLTPANASNTWALAVRRDVARANKLQNMSDFGRWATSGGDIVLACSAEFANAGALRSLERTYAFTLRSDQLIVLAGGETSATIRAAAARTNGTNTAMVYGTDGGVTAANLQILLDDKHDQPVYAPVPLIREAVLRANPRIAVLVKPLMESFSADSLQKLNERVQIDGEAAQVVAEDYLKAQGLLK
jgi:osmoprotectant transport system substrate-binding protein